MKKIVTKSEKETLDLGKKLAKGLKGGEVIGLQGELGAGKTVLVRGLAKGLGIKKNITSPTFLLMRVYPVKRHKTIKQLCHIDAYRISGLKDLEAVGVYDYSGKKDVVCVIEWIEKLPELAKLKNFKKIQIDLDEKDNNKRIIKIFS